MRKMNIKQILFYLKESSNTEDQYGMEKFGIKFKKAFGVRMPVLRALGKKIGKDHFSFIF